MADLVGDSFSQVTSGINLSSTVGVITIFLIASVVCGIIIGLVAWWFVSSRYKYKIVVFEKINGALQPTRKDKAMAFKLNDHGDEVFYLRKHKKYLPKGNIQTGIRIYWYYIREDDEWINFGLDDIDTIMRKAGVKYLDKEMRFARSGLIKNMKERFQKPSFLSVYGGLILYGIFILLTGIMAWFLFDKFIDIAEKISGAMKTALEVANAQKEIIDGLQILKGQGGLIAK